MEYFDVVDEKGQPTGDIVTRDQAHTKGIRHRTVHVWVVKEYRDSLVVLMQKRSANKDSFPGQYDTSCAGHVEAGESVLDAAIRELHEELGINTRPEKLELVCTFPINYAEEFYNELFVDNEVAFLYVYKEPVNVDDLVLQPEEVESVAWFNLEYVWKQLCKPVSAFCAPLGGLLRIREWYMAEKAAQAIQKALDMLRKEE